MASNSSAILVPPPGSTNAVSEGLRPGKGLVEIPTFWTWLGWALLVLLVGALAAWLVRWWRRRPKPAGPSIPPLPAHLRARARLVDSMHWIGEPKVFCTAVSSALRDYLEERFEFHAPDRTTEEFLEELQASPKLSVDQKVFLARFLERCDLVKFARDEPSRPDLELLHNAALKLVDETAPSGDSDPSLQPADKGGKS